MNGLYRMIAVTLLAILLIVPAVSAQTPERDFATAWTAGGDLYVLLPDDTEPRLIAESRVSIPRLSPDASHVAFQRRDSLYTVSTDGTNERMIFDAENAPESLRSEGNVVSAGRRLWMNGDTLLFNTFQYNDFGGFANEDLHIASATSGQTVLAEIGGEFAPSPGGEWIAVTVAGYYGDFPGAVYIVDADGTNPRPVMEYTAVATATEGQFAPLLQWVDVDTFRFAIPDPDLVYMETQPNPPPVALWEVNATTGEAAQIGVTPASFFSLPVWNNSGDWLAALMRSPNDPNLVVMMFASGDGSNPTEYPVNTLQGVRVPQWTPGGERFVYIDGDTLMLGGPAMDAPLMLEAQAPLTTPAVTANGTVYAVTVDGVNEVRYMPFDGSASLTLAVTGDRVPRINAVSVTN